MDRNEVKTAAQDARFSPLQSKRAFRRNPAMWPLLGGAIVLLLGYLAFGLGPRSNQATENPNSNTSAQAPKPTQPHPSALLKKAPEASAKVHFGPLTRQHFGQFDQWIEEAPHKYYFIQLLATDATHTGEIEGFLAKARELLDPVEIRAYRSSLSGRDRVGVIYGSYPTREAAAAAMLTLPESIKAAQPFPRQVSRLL